MKHQWAWWRRRRFRLISLDIETQGSMPIVERIVGAQEFAEAHGCHKLFFVVRKTGNARRRARRRLVGGRG